jgi:hypothetical protein
MKIAKQVYRSASLLFMLLLGVSRANATTDKVYITCSLLDKDVSGYTFKFYAKGNNERYNNLPTGSTYSTELDSGWIIGLKVEIAATDRTDNKKIPLTIFRDKFVKESRGNDFIWYNWEGRAVLGDVVDKQYPSRKVSCNVYKNVPEKVGDIPATNEIGLNDIAKIFPVVQNEVGMCYPYTLQTVDDVSASLNATNGVYSPLFYSRSHIVHENVDGTKRQIPIFWWKMTGDKYETTYGNSSNNFLQTRTRFVGTFGKEDKLFDVLAMEGIDPKTGAPWSFKALFDLSINKGRMAGAALTNTQVSFPEHMFGPLIYVDTGLTGQDELFNTYLAQISYDGIMQFFTCNRTIGKEPLVTFKFNPSSQKELPVKLENDAPLPIYSRNSVPLQHGVCTYGDKRIFEWDNYHSVDEVKIDLMASRLELTPPEKDYVFHATLGRDLTDRGRLSFEINEYNEDFMSKMKGTQLTKNTAFFEYNDTTKFNLQRPNLNDLTLIDKNLFDGLITMISGNDKEIGNWGLWKSTPLFVEDSENLKPYVFEYTNDPVATQLDTLPQDYYAKVFRDPNIQKQLFDKKSSLGNKWNLWFKGKKYDVDCKLEPAYETVWAVVRDTENHDKEKHSGANDPEKKEPPK